VVDTWLLSCVTTVAFLFVTSCLDKSALIEYESSVNSKLMYTVWRCHIYVYSMKMSHLCIQFEDVTFMYIV